MAHKQKDMKKTSLYLCGPMRGIENYNFSLFNWTAKWLRKKGYTVWNPAEQDIKKDGFDPAKDTPRPIKEYMVRDLAALCTCDAIVVLNGWEHSKGATLEVSVARQLDMPVLDVALRVIEPPAPTVLQDAEALISGDRHAQYGAATQDFKRIADMWTGLLQYKLKDGERIRPQDVAWFMMLLKASRAQYSNKRDNAVDAAGYLSLAWDCARHEEDGK